MRDFNCGNNNGTNNFSEGGDINSLNISINKYGSKKEIFIKLR